MSAYRPQSFERLAYPSGETALAPISFRAASGHGRAYGSFQRKVKRLEDIVCALVFLIVASFPMVLIAVAVRLTSAGPVFFRQQRIGLHGNRFIMLKFRTMRNRPEMPGTCPQATRDDPRVTRLGGWLRRYSCDELPQLFNVLNGSMSIVGPRPHAPGTCVAGKPFEAVSHRYAARHGVKPGMTGLAQVRGWRGETDTEEKLLNRIDCDLEYIANWSLWSDLKIIGRTMVTVMRMPNAY